MTSPLLYQDQMTQVDWSSLRSTASIMSCLQIRHIPTGGLSMAFPGRVGHIDGVVRHGSDASARYLCEDIISLLWCHLCYLTPLAHPIISSNLPVSLSSLDILNEKISLGLSLSHQGFVYLCIHVLRSVPVLRTPLILYSNEGVLLGCSDSGNYCYGSIINHPL